MNLACEVKNLFLPVEADQSFQPRFNRGALGLQPRGPKGFPDEFVVNFDVGSDLSRCV
jgi:hypothetical protein